MGKNNYNKYNKIFYLYTQMNENNYFQTCQIKKYILEINKTKSVQVNISSAS